MLGLGKFSQNINEVQILKYCSPFLTAGYKKIEKL